MVDKNRTTIDKKFIKGLKKIGLMPMQLSHLQKPLILRKLLNLFVEPDGHW